MFQLHAKCSYPLHSTILFLSTHPPFQKKKKKEGGKEEKKGGGKAYSVYIVFLCFGWSLS